MVSKHHRPLVWSRRDDDSAAIAKVQLNVLTRLLDPLLPWSNDGVPVDPNDSYDDDNDAEDNAELGWRVQALPGVIGARSAVVTKCLAPGDYGELLNMGLKRWHDLHLLRSGWWIDPFGWLGWLVGLAGGNRT